MLISRSQYSNGIFYICLNTYDILILKFYIISETCKYLVSFRCDKHWEINNVFWITFALIKIVKSMSLHLLASHPIMESVKSININ